MKKFKIRTGLGAVMAMAITGGVLCNGVVLTAEAAEATPSFNLDQMVVTASRLQETEFTAAANINVITRKQIENSHFTDLTEALQTVPGVTITRYGGGTGYEQAEGILINGSSQILVLIDGTRANMNGSTFAVFSFGAMKNMDNIERIEILKGSASTLYGSDAKGGVINIITKDAAAKPKTTLSVMNGSYDREQYRLNHEGRSKNTSWVLGVQKDKSGSFKDAKGLETPASLDSTTINLKIKQKLNEKSDLTMVYDKYTADYMYSGTNFNVKERHYGTADNYNWRLIHNIKLSEKADNKLSVFSQNTNTNYDNWLMDLQTIGFTDQYTHKLSDNNTLIAGVEYYQEKIKDYKEMGMSGSSPLTYSGLSLSNKSVFLQDSWDFTEKWNLAAGVRYDSHSKAGNKVSPSATLDYKFNKNTHMYASYKSYFVAPNQYQYFSPYGNENLKPESGKTYELGLAHAFDDSCTLRINVFKRDAKDVVGFAYGYPVTPSNPWGGKYVNVDAETANGWNVQLNKQFTKELSASVGFTHIEVKSQPASGGESINRYIPKGEYHIGMNYNKNKFEAALTGHGVIDRPGEGKADHPAFPTDSYWVWDLGLNYKFNPSVRAFVKANNIFNQFYAEHSNVKWGNPDEWYTSPGRNFLVGVEYSF